MVPLGCACLRRMRLLMLIIGCAFMMQAIPAATAPTAPPGAARVAAAVKPARAQSGPLTQSSANTHHFAFVDTTVADRATLARAARLAGMKVVNVASAAAMQAALAGRSNLAAVHVFSHGTPGSLTVGTDTRPRATLDRYEGLTAMPNSSLAAEAELLRFACRVSEGSVWRACVGDVVNAAGG